MKAQNYLTGVSCGIVKYDRGWDRGGKMRLEWNQEEGPSK